MKPRKLLLALLSAIPLITLAVGEDGDETSSGKSIYKSVGPDGRVIFSDKLPPGEKGETVELGPTNVQPIALPRTLPTRKLSPQDQGNHGYAGPIHFAIVSPVDGATIPPGQRLILLEVAIDPVPDGEYSFFVVVDGQPWAGSSTGDSIDISALERGTHSVQAVLVDSVGKEIARSQVITLYVKRPGGVLPDNSAAQASQAPTAPLAPGLPRAQPRNSD